MNVLICFNSTHDFCNKLCQRPYTNKNNPTERVCFGEESLCSKEKNDSSKRREQRVNAENSDFIKNNKSAERHMRFCVIYTNLSTIHSSPGPHGFFYDLLNLFCPA